MWSVRKCSRTGCHEPAVATLTYAYLESTAVVGPLATSSEPHSYDLCEAHATRLTVPRGWEVVRHEGDFSPPEPTVDELTALAEAVREAGRPEPAEPRTAVSDQPGERRATGTEPGRRGHLRVLPGHA